MANYVLIESSSNIVVNVDQNSTFNITGSEYFELTSSFYFPPIIQYGWWLYVPDSGSEIFFKANAYRQGPEIIINDVIISGSQNISGSQMITETVVTETGSFEYLISPVFEGTSSWTMNAESSSYATTASYIEENIPLFGTQSVINVYDSTGGQTITTSDSVINLDTTRINTAPATFSLELDDSIGIATDGVYEMTYGAYLESLTTTRALSDIWLERYDGTNWNEISGSRSTGYHRTTAAGREKPYNFLVDFFSSGSRFRISTVRVAGNLTTVVGSLLIIKSMQSIKGEIGSQGIQGISGPQGVPGPAGADSVWTASYGPTLAINRESDVYITGSFYVQGTGSFGNISIDWVESSSYSETSSYAKTASYVESSSYSTTASYAETTANVLGTDFHHASTTNTDTWDSTTSTSPLQILRLSTPSNMIAGTFKISWYFEWSRSNNTADFRSQIQIDDTTTVMNHSQELQDPGTDQMLNNSGFYIGSLTSGIHNIDLDYWAENATSYIRRARLEIYRIE